MRTVNLLFILLLASCGGNRDIKTLKPDIDKPEDVRSKYGDPDTVFRRYEDGFELEYWYYENDSTGIKFVNGKLSEIRTADTERARMTQEARDEEYQENRRKAILDSIEKSIGQ